MADASGSVIYPVTVSGTGSVNITASDINLGMTGGANCTKGVTGGTTTSVTVTLSACSGITGTVNISVAAGVASDAAGNNSAITGPSAIVTVGTSAFTQSWSFDALDSASYSLNSSKIDFTGGVCRLTGNDQVDNDNTASGFGGGNFKGMAIWDSARSYVRLDTSAPCVAAHSCAELDASWTPKYASLVAYWTLNTNYNDSIGTFNAAAVGGVSLTTSAKLGTHAAVLNGSNGVLNAGSAFNFGSQDFSFAFWINPTTYTTGPRGKGPSFFIRVNTPLPDTMPKLA